jgi:catechol-2,3-dioxygenase
MATETKNEVLTEARVKPLRLGHLVLRVRDLDRTERFYAEILGLHVTGKVPGRMIFFSASGDSSHELAATAVGPNAPGPEDTRVGLYHFAWQMGSVQDLEQMHRRLKSSGVQIVGIGDHGNSFGIYFLDPDGNEIEIFYELPKDQWAKGKAIPGGKFPLNVNLD